MKKAVRQFLCMAMALCIIACCLPQRADAYSTRYNSSIHTLKQKTYVTSKGYVSSYALYTAGMKCKYTEAKAAWSTQK